MMHKMEVFKLAFLNAATWLATAASLTMVKDVLQILAILASIAVSVASFIWVRKQAKAFDAKQGKAQE